MWTFFSLPTLNVRRPAAPAPIKNYPKHSAPNLALAKGAVTPQETVTEVGPSLLIRGDFKEPCPKGLEGGCNCFPRPQKAKIHTAQD